LTASLCVAARACRDEGRLQKILHPCGASNKGLDNPSHSTLKSTHLECCGHPSTGLPQRANRHHAGRPDCVLHVTVKMAALAGLALAALSEPDKPVQRSAPTVRMPEISPHSSTPDTTSKRPQPAQQKSVDQQRMHPTTKPRHA
jgi:hypothetical protein